MEINVLTYNIRLGLDSSIAAIAEAIQTEGIPDLIALQEVGRYWQMGECIDQTQVLSHALGLHGHFCGALTDENQGQFGIALLSRYPMLDLRRTELPRVDDEQRVLLEARIDTPVPLTVLTSHFSIHEPERRRQATMMAEKASRCQTPVIALGDFNAKPDSVEYETLTGEMTDAFARHGIGSADTFSVRSPHRQIDYVMTGSGASPVKSCRVLRHIQTSDHFPLAACIQLPPPPDDEK